MKVLKDGLIVFVILAVLFGIFYGIFLWTNFVKRTSYRFFYEKLVKQTITEMVEPESLKGFVVGDDSKAKGKDSVIWHKGKMYTSFNDIPKEENIDNLEG